jgi:peptide/nickel transport system permease protein
MRALAASLCSAALLMLAVVMMSFVLLQLAPGDPAQALAGEMGGGTAETLAEIRRSYGLDQPAHVQLLTWLGRVLVGDLGRSIFFNQPVTALIGQHLPATLLLAGAAMAFAIPVGTWLGVQAARRPQGWLSPILAVLSLTGFAAPVFWTGTLLLLAFASAIPLFPVQGMSDPALQARGLAHALDVAHHLVLPAATLGMVYLAQYSRLARASMLEVLGADYIRTARAKGLTEGAVIWRHALRNAVLPLVTVAGVQVSHLLAGAVLVETVFGWPGIGRLAFESILRRDVPLMLGILLCSALLVVVTNTLTDLAYRVIDPRISRR